MQSSWLFFNIDELIYRMHLFFSGIFEWLWYIVSLKWIFGDSSAAKAVEAGQLGVGCDAGFFDRWFGSSFFRMGSSRPSAEHDSIQQYLNPAADRSVGDILWGMLFGTGDKESIFSIIFGSFLGWIIILAILGVIWKRFLKDKIHFMEHRHKLMYELAQDKYQTTNAKGKSERWEKILQQIGTDDVNQWKIAIIDADVLLDEVLRDNAYVGDTVADKLKDAQRSGLTTLQYAWEAHKIRNKIAHDSSYVLTQREAKTAISMFERFFNELYHL